jgi:protein-S-isoprenylcysteine O-methyltransferase Ste14
VDPFHPERTSTLVTTGPNSITRNPMYVGMAGLLVAHAVLRGKPVALLPVGGFVTIIDRWQIGAEEPALATHFGQEYDAYRARTPRWLGFPLPST